MLETKILTKLEKLAFYSKKFPDFLPSSLDLYKNSLKDQMAIERLFQVSIECMIDVAFSLIKLLHLSIPSDEENIFDLLEDYLDNVEIYKEMKRFRNLLVHQYAKINEELVYTLAKEKITDFELFIREVKEILRNLE